MSQHYILLVEKIEVFIRKYYKNQLIKGFLLSLALIISFFLLLAVLEHFLRFSTLLRAIMFYTYLASAASILFIYILKPTAGLVRLGKRLTKTEAAEIIGKHFPEIKDKLLNTLQLQQSLEQTSNEDIWLLEAAINQKSNGLSPIPFHSAIQFSINKKYLRYFIPPIIILVILSWYSPKIILDSSDRIYHYDQDYIVKAPFQFNIQNNELQCLQGEDFELNVEITGEIIPDEVFIVIDNYPFKIKKSSSIEFQYLFKNILNTKTFFFQAGNHQSPIYEIKVQPFPKIISFSANLDYPNYLGKKDEVLKNIGDFTVPEGTKISWNFNTKDISSLILILAEKSMKLKYNQEVIKSPEFKLLQNTKYSLVPINDFIIKPDTLSYTIEVIKDQYPGIQVLEYRDSLNEKRIYFQGLIKDDYGFKKLLFKWKPADNTEGIYSQKRIKIQQGVLQQKFYYFVDIDSMGIGDGESIKYYFEIWDNDAVNGSKTSKTLLQSLRKASKTELDSTRNKIDSDIKDQMKKSINEAKEINKKAEKLSKKLLEKKQMDWQDKQELKELIKQHQKMLNNIEKLQKAQELSQQKNKELSEEDERLLEKQKQLQELFDKLMTPEMKKMMEEMQKMMQEEINKEEAKEMLEKMQLDNKELEKQLDRDLEIFKQMEFDQKLQEAINQLDSLRSEQKKLSEDLENKNINEDDAAKKQEELNKKFEEFEKKLEDAKKANEELQKPNEMGDFEKEKKEISDKMKESSESLEKGKKKSASKMQNSASDSMEKLSEKLKQMQSDMEMQSNSESMEDLRDILANLIETSFKQEILMNEVKGTSNTDPKYPTLIRRQKDIKSDLKMIEDSLISLSKRQAAISPMVNKEISHINLNMQQTLEALLALNTIGYTSRGQKNLAIGKQQQIMTSVNNLALMLSEALEQMQQQQMQSKGSKGNCKKPKPGQGSGSMKSIRQMQQALNKQMKKMQEQMKKGKGKQKGPKKGNGQQGPGGEKMSEEMARMAAQQEMIRRKLQTYQESLKKQGNGGKAGDLNKVAKDMEQNETELVNNLLLRESIMRQEEILTRLLEAEKAEREQKQEERREAKEGVDKTRLYPPGIEEFIKQQNKEVELLKTIPPNLKPFYKNKVNIYFEQINNH